jgi:hypothetical protein
MDDVEHQLARIGYRGDRREAECWRVAPVEPHLPIPRGAAACRRSRDHSPVLRFWLTRLRNPPLPSPYRICRENLR